MSEQVNLHEAKTHLSKLIKRVELGEEIIIARAGHPVAKLTAIAPQHKPRMPGSARGKIRISDDFDAPLPSEIIRDFES